MKLVPGPRLEEPNETLPHKSKLGCSLPLHVVAVGDTVACPVLGIIHPGGRVFGHSFPSSFSCTAHRPRLHAPVITLNDSPSGIFPGCLSR
jgi:hypothetical protein